MGFWGFPCGSAGKESACNVEDLGSIPGLGRSPGEGKGYSLQYSGLENSMDCIVRGVAKSWTKLPMKTKVLRHAQGGCLEATRMAEAKTSRHTSAGQECRTCLGKRERSQIARAIVGKQQGSCLECQQVYMLEKI